ncbi:MAG: 5-methyltetrahydropteroyltriglutamate--homocysteine S-methyltransferase [Planctomycetota bacterium]|nr:5-methyltetrahydropteroyltriglutamate--homocysteine S-methyltransferase [Planctomycetota bacterium]
MMIRTASLGFPRIGPRRELKWALERFWSGACDDQAFGRSLADLRCQRWQQQRAHGIDIVPSNDFALYDHVLDHCCMLGAVPERFGFGSRPLGLHELFRMARGGEGAPPLEMTKWFDTNYHYLVPELAAGMRFRAEPSKAVEEFRAALALGIRTRPVLIGPLTFLRLSKRVDGGPAIELLPQLLPAYRDILRSLAEAGADDIQIDEPILATDLAQAERAAFPAAYRALADAAPGQRLLLATYFGAIDEYRDIVCALPVHGLHLDLVRAPEQLPAILESWPRERTLSLGLVDGRNVWRCDLAAALSLAEHAAARRGIDNLQIAPSCSLLHVPIDLAAETALDPALAAWLAFAVQKCEELALIARGLADGRAAIAEALAACEAALAARRASPLTRRAEVRERQARLTAGDRLRTTPRAARLAAQRVALGLPLFPTTTIGSFPQTAAVRKARADHRAGVLDDAGYTAFLRAEIERCVRFQERIGLDVLVHGEFERNDMVEYFGEQLDGFLVTEHGWVQSYGSRCVKPPIIVGDVARRGPMTVSWTSYAQSLTAKPMKGMLTGPVTILQWSFVRDDLPRAQVAEQIALALRDEVRDLEQAGVRVIQVDEPAFREGLPLRRRDWPAYLHWAIAAFRLCTAGVADATQIHTHMCYSEFNDIIDSIAELDADVISIETARSRMELLAAFERFRYPADIGPGVYDIHSPSVPETAEMVAMLERASQVLDPERLWVNPDCGLKTRRWQEVEAALPRMVEAARLMRHRHRTAPAQGA